MQYVASQEWNLETMKYSYIGRQLHVGLVTALLGPPLDVDLPRVTKESFQRGNAALLTFAVLLSSKKWKKGKWNVTLLTFAFLLSSTQYMLSVPRLSVISVAHACSWRRRDHTPCRLHGP